MFLSLERTPRVNIVAAANLSAREASGGGRTATYTLGLNAAPTADVVVTLQTQRSYCANTTSGRMG